MMLCLNQVLVSFGPSEVTRRVITEVQNEGTAWCGGTVWQGQTAMRISVSSWATQDEDVERSLAAIIRTASKKYLHLDLMRTRRLCWLSPIGHSTRSCREPWHISAGRSLPILDGPHTNVQFYHPRAPVSQVSKAPSTWRALC